MDKSKFKIGDKVKIVNYGHPVLVHTKSEEYKIFKNCNKPIIEQADNIIVFDIHPEYVGQIGTIQEISKDRWKFTYSTEGTSKTAWWNEDQLEIIK